MDLQTQVWTVLSSSLPPVRPRKTWLIEVLHVQAVSTVVELKVGPLASRHVFNVRFTGSKAYPVHFLCDLGHGARGFFTLVTWNVMLEFSPSFVLKWTFFSPRLGILFPLAAIYVTPVCDPTEGLVCISGMRPSGHTDSAAHESTVIFPPVHCFSTGQRFGSSHHSVPGTCWKYAALAGTSFLCPRSRFRIRRYLPSSTSPTSVFPSFASSFCLVQQSRGR